MGEKVLDTLSNNKLLVALLMALVTWVGVQSRQVSAVELKVAVQQEQINNLTKSIEEIKSNTEKILDRVGK